ncbi:hypothetical protein QTV49_000400 [Vibrio vulnificus]|nr:hypothetical protein [Vibrio vulnificus]
MKVVIESPFANKNPFLLSENLIYLNCVARYLTKEEKLTPLFFHSYYTQFLDDMNEEERNIGLNSSFEFHDEIKVRIITIDRGISTGMRLGMLRGIENGATPVFFSLDKENSSLQETLNQINSIEDPLTRWETGLKELERITRGEPKNDFGDLTGYREYSSTLRTEVCNVLERFFTPLSQHIAQTI